MSCSPRALSPPSLLAFSSLPPPFPFWDMWQGKVYLNIELMRYVDITTTKQFMSVCGCVRVYLYVAVRKRKRAMAATALGSWAMRPDDFPARGAQWEKNGGKLTAVAAE